MLLFVVSFKRANQTEGKAATYGGNQKCHPGEIFDFSSQLNITRKHLKISFSHHPPPPPQNTKQDPTVSYAKLRGRRSNRVMFTDLCCQPGHVDITL